VGRGDTGLEREEGKEGGGEGNKQTSLKSGCSTKNQSICTFDGLAPVPPLKFF
jgi:hypothetical protein